MRMLITDLENLQNLVVFENHHQHTANPLSVVSMELSGDVSTYLPLQPLAWLVSSPELSQDELL